MERNSLLFFQDLQRELSILPILNGELFISALNHLYLRINNQPNFKEPLEYLSDIDNNRRQYLAFYLTEIGNELESYLKSLEATYNIRECGNRASTKYEKIREEINNPNITYYILDLYHDLRHLTEYIYCDTENKKSMIQEGFVRVDDLGRIQEYITEEIWRKYLKYAQKKDKVYKESEISPDTNYYYLVNLSEQSDFKESQLSLLEVFSKEKYLLATNILISYLFDYTNTKLLPKLRYESKKLSIPNLKVSFDKDILNFEEHGYVKFSPNKSQNVARGKPYIVGSILSKLCENKLKIKVSDLNPELNINNSDFYNDIKDINKALIRDISNGKLKINAILEKSDNKNEYRLSTFKLQATPNNNDEEATDET